jgi:ATP-dependent DNA helicase RecG
MEAFNQGRVRSRRYRNRRLGEFLKELELTEGRATGIPTILKALHENGSPAPRFTSDEDRTFFEVELFIHPAFVEKAPFVIEKGEFEPSHQGIDVLLEKLLDYNEINHDEVTNSAIAGNIAGNIAEDIKAIDNQADELVDAVSSTIAGNIAGAIAGAIAESEQKVLEWACSPKQRETIFKHLGVTNQMKNYESYMLPLVNMGWLTMTIPNKPTSPNQKYLTTLKGRLILKFLKMNKT